MDKEVSDNLEVISKLLNGQIRGAINAQARKENLELIQITLSSVWTQAVEYVSGMIEDVEILERIKKELKSDGEDDS